MMQDVAATIQSLVEKNQNALDLRCPDDVGTIHTDLTKVRQTLFNLLSNAVKYTPEGRILLGCRGHGRQARIAVVDNGAGIAAQPGRDIPSASASEFMVEAVPMTMQCPILRTMPSSISR